MRWRCVVVSPPSSSGWAGGTSAFERSLSRLVGRLVVLVGAVAVRTVGRSGADACGRQRQRQRSGGGGRVVVQISRFPLEVVVGDATIGDSRVGRSGGRTRGSWGRCGRTESARRHTEATA